MILVALFKSGIKVSWVIQLLSDKTGLDKLFFASLLSSCVLQALGGEPLFSPAVGEYNR